jgi:hypothetical protein
MLTQQYPTLYYDYRAGEIPAKPLVRGSASRKGDSNEFQRF